MSMLHALAALMPKPLNTLTQKGYGHVYDTGETSSLSMSYANVDGGTAPAAGDLVIWIALAGDTGGSPVATLTGSGWSQGSRYVSSFLATTILAKVVTSGDISSPPVMISAPNFGSIGFWVAYSVDGSFASLTVSTPNAQYGGASPQVCDSSAVNAPNVAITLGAGGGDDNTPSLSISGAAADITFTSSNDRWDTNNVEDRFIVNATVGGANITFSNGNDGTETHMVSGFVTVTFA